MSFECVFDTLTFLSQVGTFTLALSHDYEFSSPLPLSKTCPGVIPQYQVPV